MKKKRKSKKKKEDNVLDLIAKALGYKTLLKPPKWWLDTGYKRLNAVFGSTKYGLASGKLYLLAGKETSGKSLLAAKIAAIAQQIGAMIGWVDAEGSYDKNHVRRQGLDPDNVVLFEPLYGHFDVIGGKKAKKKKKKSLNLERVEPAEYLLTRVEMWMKLMRRKNPDGKLLLVIDSTNQLSPEGEEGAGYTDRNMKTTMAMPVFLNVMTKRLLPLSIHTNAIIIMISQLRTNPAKMFGNPDYIPGGGGLKYNPSSIVWMRRVKDGAIMKKGVQIGVKGLISNTKNKVGGKSKERKKAGYMSHFFKDKWKFVSADTIKGEI